MIDIVIPKNNEEELLAIAKKLGYSGLLFIYDKTKKSNLKNCKTGLICKNSHEINKNKGKIDFILANNEIGYNDKRVDFVFDLEKNSKKDYIHHRGSGMNHVTAKQLAQNKTSLAFDFNSVLKSKQKDKIIGKMMQNVMLCRKYKVKTIIASFATSPYEMRAAKDLISFGITLGMNPGEAKKAVNWE